MNTSQAMSTTDTRTPQGSKSARVEREIDLEGVKGVHGVTFDGERVWFAHGDEGELLAVSRATGARERSLRVPADGGVAFDGECLWVAGGSHLRRIDRETGAILAEIESPAGADTSGLAWHDGDLWVGSYKNKVIFKVDPKTGKVKKRIASDRLVTGVTFRGDELWHGAVERDAATVKSELRRVDADSGQVTEARPLADGIFVSGTESDDRGRVWCGDPTTGKLRVVVL